MQNYRCKSSRVASAVLLAALGLAWPVSAEDAVSDEAAIRANVASYVDAYNRGDAHAVAELWSDAGQWISPAGERYYGRQAIEAQLKRMLGENQGRTIEVTGLTIRIVSPDAAVEEGTVTLSQANEQPSDSRYVAFHVKRDDGWQLDSVYETDTGEAPSSDSPLEELGWLEGHWIDQSDDATLEATVSWTKNRTFLNYAFKVSVPGMDDLEGTQVIGWDPAGSTIRSWMFDSDGGIGQGIWSKSGNRWTVKFEQVLPDGRVASATNIYTFVDRDTCIWNSIGRKLDGEFLPNVDEVTMVRTPTETAAR
jgi:uncharacterized protein (TIGR02246 family)